MDRVLREHDHDGAGHEDRGEYVKGNGLDHVASCPITPAARQKSLRLKGAFE